LLRFGLSLLTGRVLYYIGTRAIELVLLYRHSATILSYYVIGSRLYFVLAQMIMAVLIDVSFATLSRIADDRVALQNAFLPMIRTASIVAVPIFLGLAAVAPEACVVAFGDKGEEAAVYLQIVALFGALQVTQHFLSSMLGVVGRPGVATAILAVRAALVALVVLPGWALDPMAILKAIAPAYLAGGAMLLAVLAARWALAGQVPDVFLRLAVLAGIGALTYAVLLLLFAPKLVRSQIQAIRARIRGKARAAG
jgi:O-antigen/teichoic acid export membrane protein